MVHLASQHRAALLAWQPRQPPPSPCARQASIRQCRSRQRPHRGATAAAAGAAAKGGQEGEEGEAAWAAGRQCCCRRCNSCRRPRTRGQAGEGRGRQAGRQAESWQCVADSCWQVPISSFLPLCFALSFLEPAGVSRCLGRSTPSLAAFLGPSHLLSTCPGTPPLLSLSSFPSFPIPCFPCFPCFPSPPFP